MLLPADAVRQRLDADFAFLADEQRAAVLAATTAGDLPLIAGRAGSGKTAMARAIVEAYRAAGMRVQGAALTGKAAEGLSSATGIDSRTLASLRRAWAKGYDQLDAKTVLLVDEAGMLGTREMGELLATAEQVGAKVILIGDPDQLRSIEAGDAFAGLLEIYRGSRLETTRRQRIDWMRDASTDFADGRVADALNAYDKHNAVHWSEDLGAAKWDLVSAYFADVDEHGDADRLVLARRNADVDELNDLIRARRRQRDELGRAIRLRGREMAEGDRVVFTRNDHDGRLVVNIPAEVPTDESTSNEIGVKNGTLGTLVHATRDGVHVRLDDGRLVAFDPRRYQDLRVGYAVTLHKSQGATVDRAFALLDPHLDRHGAYVAATRHRDHLGLWFDRQSFADLDAAARILGRRGPNDLWFLAEGRTNEGAEDEATERLRRAIEKDAVVRFDKLLTDPEDLDEVEVIQGLPELAWVDAEHVTTHEYLDTERHLSEIAERLSMRVSSRIGVGDHLPPEAEADPIVRAVDGPDLTVFEGNRDDALDHFRAISDQYRLTDRELIAVAFTSRAAHELGADLGVESHTVAGLKYRTNRLGAKTVLLVDQANLVDVRTLDTVLTMAEEAGSRVVLVGDPNGFDPIGAGDAFRLVREDLGAVALRPELEASVIEAQERFHALDAAGSIHIVGGAEHQIVERYLDATVDERPMILTHTRASAAAINELIREERADELGRTIEIGDRPFAEGDRVVFTASDPKAQAVRTVEGPVRDDRAGVRSGELGTIESVGDDLRVRLDDGRLVAVDPEEFNAIDYGYALTTFRANGSRADDVIVLAEPSMDRAAALVALSSHDRSLEIVAADWAFESSDDLAKTFARERGKLLARDIQNERVQSPRPEHRTDPTVEALEVDRTKTVTAEGEDRWAIDDPYDDPACETIEAIRRLRRYDAAPARLDAIRQQRERLAALGDDIAIQQRIAGSGDEETRRTYEQAARDLCDCDAEEQRCREVLAQGRDALVEKIFEASRQLEPDGFMELPAADRAIVRELWEITIQPIDEAAAAYEHAAREHAVQAAADPEVPPVESLGQTIASLGTRAALAAAPQPVRRVAAAALTIADYYRDTPRALLRTLTPEPIRRIQRAVQLVGQLVGAVPEPRPSQPSTVWIPEPEPSIRWEPPRDPDGVFRLADLRSTRHAPAYRAEVDRDGKSRLVFEDERQRWTSAPMPSRAWARRLARQLNAAPNAVDRRTLGPGRKRASGRRYFVAADGDAFRVYYDGNQKLGRTGLMSR
ncbi:MAG: AAA family ATPase, partial [Acidobacteriota bacterium]